MVNTMDQSLSSSFHSPPIRTAIRRTAVPRIPRSGVSATAALPPMRAKCQGSDYQKHRGQFAVRTWPNGVPAKVSGEVKKTIDSVLSFYGDKAGQWLSELTHKERPWLDARKGLSDDDRGNREISLAALAEYYGAL